MIGLGNPSVPAADNAAWYIVATSTDGNYPAGILDNDIIVFLQTWYHALESPQGAIPLHTGFTAIVTANSDYSHNSGTAKLPIWEYRRAASRCSWRQGDSTLSGTSIGQVSATVNNVKCVVFRSSAATDGRAVGADVGTLQTTQSPAWTPTWTGEDAPMFPVIFACAARQSTSVSAHTATIGGITATIEENHVDVRSVASVAYLPDYDGTVEDLALTSNVTGSVRRHQAKSIEV